MAPVKVTIVPNLFDGSGTALSQGWAVFTPQATLTDAPDAMLITMAPVQVPIGTAAQLIATDSPGPLPAGWSWSVAFRNVPGNPVGWSFQSPAGPCSFTATNASPCVFTWTPTAAFTSAGLTTMPNGTVVTLAGGSLPAGFTATSYYVANSTGATFQLSATLGGSAIGSTSTGSGTLTVVQYELSALAVLTSVTALATAMPVPSGSANSGYVPVATGTGEASAWSPVPGVITGMTVASANGLAGTVANPTTAPAVTLSTTVTGLVKGNGTALSAATAGTDYVAPTGSGAALTGITAAQVGAASTGALTTETGRAEAAEALLAPLASPTFTGTPAVPTAAAGTSTTQAASTAYAYAASSLASGTGLTVQATSAAQIARINAAGLPGYATLPSPSLSVMAGDNSTNDEPALAALVTYLGAAYAATGQVYVIHCPAGVYLLQNNSPVWASGVGLVGDGPAQTIFKCSNPGNANANVSLAVFLAAFQSASTSNYLADCRFEGFTVDGSGVSQSAYNYGAKGFNLQFMLRPIFRNVTVQYFGASGFGCDHLVDAQFELCRALYNGRLANGAVVGTFGGAGFGIGTGGWNGTGYTEGGDFVGCVARGNGTHGLFFEIQNSAWPMPEGFRVIGGRYEGNQFGISDWGCTGLIVSGAHMVNNIQHGLNVSGNSGVSGTAGTDGVVTGCAMDSNGLDGACVGDTQRYKLVGNRHSGNGRHGVHFYSPKQGSSYQMNAVTLEVSDVFGNGVAGVWNDGYLNNPFWIAVMSRNNGVQSAASASNSGGTVAYTAFTLTDTAASWVVNGHTGKTVTSGSVTGIVQSNTATALTLWPISSNGTTGWGASGVPSSTPSSGASYSLPAAVAQRAGFTNAGTLNHACWRNCRGWDDNATRIQPYGFYSMGSGVSNSAVSDNDFLGNLTASVGSTVAPSGGYWTNNAGASAGFATSTPAMLTDGPAQFTSYVQPGNGTAVGGHIYSGSGAPSITGSIAGDWYLRTDTPGTTAQALYIATGSNTWQNALPFVDLANAQSVGGAKTFTSGVAPATSGFTAFGAGGFINALNTTSGTSVTPVAGTVYYAAVYIPFNATLTGIAVTVGSTAGTDSWIVGLFPVAGGAALATSNLAGTAVTGTTNIKQKFPFTSTYAAVGPGVYLIGVQSNGTTAKFLSFPNVNEGFATGSQAGSFGTMSLTSPSATYTAGTGPFSSTY